MTPEQVWAAVRPRLPGLGGVVTEPVRFIDDSNVTYEPATGARLRALDLFPVDNAASWQPFLHPAPQWLHLNLLAPSDASSIVTLRRSLSDAPDQKGETAINASVDPNPVTLT